MPAACVGQSLRSTGDQLDGDRGGKQMLWARAVVERLALDILHRQVEQVVGLAHVEQRHDAGMDQLSRRPGLAQETRACFLEVRAAQCGEALDDLDRDVAIDLRVVGQIDPTHRSASEFAANLVSSDLGGCHQSGTAVDETMSEREHSEN